MQGLLAGVPIGLGYAFVSLGFGVLAGGLGLTVSQAVVISACNLTSAGQLAGATVMAGGGTLVELAITQLFLNMRYLLMSIGLSQRLDADIPQPVRLGLAFFVTDEVYAVLSSQKGKLTVPFWLGLASLPALGWVLGTWAGAALGALLPPVLLGGMNLLLYGMFIAIIVPPMRVQRGVCAAVLLAILLHLCLRFVPLFAAIPAGFSIVLSALVASALCAAWFPVQAGAAVAEKEGAS